MPPQEPSFGAAFFMDVAPMRRAVLACCLLVLGALVSCATPVMVNPAADGWHKVALPGKKATVYAADLKDGRHAIRADADASASLWRRTVDIPPDRLNDVSWSWWIDGPIAEADLSDADRSDAPARVVFAFDGDRSTLSARTRMMFDLARAVSGEEPPYATLMYVHGHRHPVGTIVHSKRSDRIRKIVLEGDTSTVRQWREHRRNLAADFELAFGEPPGRLIGIAIMTDTDNTRSKARAWYGPIEVKP